MEYPTLPSSTRSSTPVIVTVCGTFQFAAVNVRLDASTVPSAVLLEEMPMTTSAVGATFSTTLKVAVPPASVVIRPEVGVIVNDGKTPSKRWRNTPSASPAPLPDQATT